MSLDNYLSYYIIWVKFLEKFNIADSLNLDGFDFNIIAATIFVDWDCVPNQFGTKQSMSG